MVRVVAKTSTKPKDDAPAGPSALALLLAAAAELNARLSAVPASTHPPNNATPAPPVNGVPSNGAHAADELLPEKLVAQRYHVSKKTLRQWDQRDDMNFPPPLILGGRRYRRLSELVAWEIERARPAARREHVRKWRKAQHRDEESISE
jgi:hypothetical protein